MTKIKPTLNSADIDLISNLFKFDLESFKRWIIQTFATKQEMQDMEEKLLHEIGNYKDDIISDYKKVDESQTILEGRVLDHDARIERLEKPSVAIVQ